MPAIVPAQTESTRRAVQVQPAGTVATWPSRAKRWALVIGVDKYADRQISTLGGSSNDAKAIAAALIRYAGFPQDQVILLTSNEPDERQPTRGNILRRLSNLVEVVPQDGLLLLSFAGHGMERSNQAFLLPSDAQVSNDVDLLEQTAINVVQIKDRIRRTGVRQVVLILDACRNDPVGRANVDNPLTPAYLRGFNFDIRNREVSAFATLYATAVGERAYEYTEKKQGYFTWELVEGLRGAAANEKGEITLAALLRHVQERVPKHVLADLGTGKEQKPFAEIGGYQADQLVIAVAARGLASAGAAEPPARPAVDMAAFELAYWETIKNSTDPEDFKSYLQSYPQGRFADLARRRSQAKSPAGTNTQATRETPAAPQISPTQVPVGQQSTAPLNQRNIVPADVFMLGVNLGVSEFAAYQNGDTPTLLQYIDVARLAAQRSGLPLDQIDYIGGQLRSGAASQSQHQALIAANQRFAWALNFTCHCGRPVNLQSVLALGTHQGFMEIGSFQNADTNYLNQLIATAIQHAAASNVSTAELQDIQRQLQGGRSSRDLHQTIVNLRNLFYQATNRACSC